MNNNDLVAKLWKLCDNLRDGGVSFKTTSMNSPRCCF